MVLVEPNAFSKQKISVFQFIGINAFKFLQSVGVDLKVEQMADSECEMAEFFVKIFFSEE